jgi:hypothetical protein
MWEEQLQAMAEHEHLDRESIADLGVVYAAETGDESLIGGQLNWVFMVVAPRIAHHDRDFQIKSTRSYSGRFGTSGSWSGMADSAYIAESWSGARTGVKAWSYSMYTSW